MKLYFVFHHVVFWSRIKKIHMYMYVIALQCKQQIDLCSMSHVLIRDA